MFILKNIEVLSDDLLNLPDNMLHKLTFKLVFTIKDVPDTFTGIVFENASGEILLQHFNSPKGNKRKVITLKNKLVKGGFERIKRALFALAEGDSVSLPLEVKTLQKRVSGTPRAESTKKT